MIQIGPIVMPCCTCNVKPGQPCVWAAGPGEPGIYFHARRFRDAALASELIAETPPPVKKPDAATYACHGYGCGFSAAELAKAGFSKGRRCMRPTTCTRQDGDPEAPELTIAVESSC